jgi:hypothetical protein
MGKSSMLSVDEKINDVCAYKNNILVQDIVNCTHCVGDILRGKKKSENKYMKV